MKQKADLNHDVTLEMERRDQGRETKQGVSIPFDVG